jgi:uncharacterized protein YkwD
MRAGAAAGCFNWMSWQGSANRSRLRARLPLGLLFMATLLLLLTPAASAAVSYDAEELSFFQQINAYRHSNGLNPLLLSDQLSLTAERHGRDMGKYRFFSHVTEGSDWYPRGSEFWQRLQIDGYRVANAGENLAAGMPDAAGAFSAWRGSPLHNANMLDPGGVRFRAIGIARVQVEGSPWGWYWVTEFGSEVDPSARDPFAAGASGPFRDVSSAHPYAEAIGSLASRQVVSGYDDGNFAPGGSLLRQQFAKMIVGALGLAVSEHDVPPFFDVPRSSPGSLYPGGYIAVAASHGIARGMEGGRFSPRASVSRAQVISMVVRAARQGGLALPPPPPSYASSWGSFSTDHAANARAAEFHGLLAGIPLAGLDPWSPISRGEVAQILHNLQERLGR